MIIIRIFEAKSILEKTVGMIGQKVPKPLLIQTRFGIHTFGMRFPIDVLVLSQNYQVIRTKINLIPNKFFFWNPKYKYVLELPSGTVKSKKIKRGSKIKLNFTS